MPKKPIVVVMLMLRILDVFQGGQRGRSAPACNRAGSFISRAGAVTCMRLFGRLSRKRSHACCAHQCHCIEQRLAAKCPEHLDACPQITVQASGFSYSGTCPLSCLP